VRWWLYKRSLETPGIESLLLRENWDQLDTTHLRKMEHEVEAIGGRFWKSDRKVSFGKGSDEAIIDCGHMADTEALGRYIGTEYGTIVPDEASLYPLDSTGIRCSRNSRHAPARATRTAAGRRWNRALCR
jgi:hypothetical protein